ncbi:4-oxalocrotonate tautomerase family protein, partial [Sandarakinorhabdus sp.]|uniref:tautomerase family protein n=1 Tax=Sandarakinorhabdus sp. TaxID=1916663 RepID=UPI0035630FF0
ILQTVCKLCRVIWRRSGAWQQRSITMPMVNIEVIEGVFSPQQKQLMIDRVTEAMVSVEGEALRSLTWVRIQEFAQGHWAIGGNSLSAADVLAVGS